MANRLRTHALRAVGLKIGHASVFWGMPTLIGSGEAGERLIIGEHCGFNDACFFDLEERVTIGNHVAVGHEVMFLTQTYDVGTGEKRAGNAVRAPIVVEDGVWVGARCTVMPGVTIGAGAVIGAGAIVTKDVAANTLLQGTQKVSLARWR